MSSSAYWSNELDKLYANKPGTSSSFYNSSFVDKINEAQANIDNLVSEKEKAWSSSQQKLDEYDAFRGSMKSYGDVWKSSENEFGVQQAKDNYESNKKALAMAQTTLNALPSSINAASNRVMTQSQREQAYNVMSDRWAKNISMQTQQNSTYEEAWKNAREKMSADISKQMEEQQNKLAGYADNWTNEINKFNQLGENIISAKENKLNWENQYRTWQYQQRQNAMAIWEAELNSTLARYNQAIENEIAAIEASRIRDRADAEAQMAWDNRSYDFGNGYSLKNSNGYAKYYYNGNEVSAGRFLEATGANGVNWDLWKSIWNSGIKTTNVGSDTIDAFNRRSSVGYDYLF